MKTYKRIRQETIQMKKLFDDLKITDDIDAINIPNFNLKVRTPYGFKNIENLFRTDLHDTVTCYFRNNKTLKCSSGHLLRTESGWKPVKDILPDEMIETEFGTTYIKELKLHDKRESLYDISVEEVHCYYSNGIVSHNSTAIMNIGAHAIQKGLDVVHYTMELTEDYTAQRYDAVITGIATQNLKYHLEDVEAELKHKVTGNLTIKYYPTKTASVNTLKAHLDQLILLKKKPDLVIVDYADLLRATSRTREKLHEDLEIIYEELRGLAGEYEIPVFTASQANRSSSEAEVITGDQIASSFAKVMVGDFIISLSRKITDKIAGTGRFFIIKNRFGPDGLTFPSKINMATGRMDIFEETSLQGKETKQDMQNGESVLRKSLAQKYKEISNDLG